MIIIDEKDIREIEIAIDYTFNDKHLLVTAFTHSSYSNEFTAENNEKLEFLGDSLLNFIVSEFLFGNMPDEGALTTARAKIVSAMPLASAVKRLNVMKFMRLGAGVLTEKVSQKFYSNLFEAIVGAIYLDGGIYPSKKFVANNLSIDSFLKTIDYKTKLQEHIQRIHKTRQIVYRDFFDEKNKKFLSRVFIFGRECGSGWGARKKEAQQSAAKIALKKMEFDK